MTCNNCNYSGKDGFRSDTLSFSTNWWIQTNELNQYYMYIYTYIHIYI